ncbi:MAG: ADP-ribosylglycohydrolase family protein, partial [Candidatus Tectimicrobiota bacterium]
MTRTLEARTLGCLLGGAVGDALGAPVEGMTRRQIRDRFGLITDYLPERFGAGVWTDDTQLTL